MKIGIVVFPGSNCDRDAFHAINSFDGLTAEFLWHKQGSIPSDLGCIVLPGGFSYGDYLRSGAIARFSPIMREVVQFASKGRLVWEFATAFKFSLRQDFCLEHSCEIGISALSAVLSTCGSNTPTHHLLTPIEQVKFFASL